MIKCPNCGSSAQIIDHRGNTYSCGCGCWFTIVKMANQETKVKEYNFLFEDEESGERFFVQCADETKCEAILLENGFDLDSVYQIGVYDDEDAEALGYDTY